MDTWRTPNKSEKLHLHIYVPPYSSLSHSTESIICSDDLKQQQDMYYIEKGCQEVHRGRKSEFWERKFPGLLPWGLEQKCRAIKRLSRLKFPTSRSRANVIECEIALQSPICPTD